MGRENVSEKRSLGPPEWALEPITAWVYFALSIVLFLVGFAVLTLMLGMAAAVFAFLERRSLGLPALWWTVCVLLVGPLGYLLFIYKRSREAVMYSPEEAFTQQARLVRGLPPKKGASSRAVPADWYPDPTGKARLRYWNGTSWTENTSD